MAGIESHAALKTAYEAMLRKAGLGHLLDERDPAELEADIRRLIAEARASEKRDGSRFGLLEGRSDDELAARLRDQLRGRTSLAYPLQQVADEVLASAREFAFSVAYPVHVGFYPTGSFNAQAMRIAQGVLLLVNTGLMLFIKQTTDLLCKSVSVSVTDNERKGTLATVPQVISHDELVHGLTGVALAYLETGSSASAPRAGMQTGVQGRLSALITRGAECFVVGHELGHAILGHLDGKRALRRATRVPGLHVDVIPKDWEEELAADRKGLQLLTPPSKMTMATHTGVERFMYRIAGAFVFFGLDALLAAVEAKVHGQRDDLVLESDHPPAQERAEAAEAWLREAGAEIALPFPRFVQGWFADLVPDVAEEVARTLTPPPLSPRAAG